MTISQVLFMAKFISNMKINILYANKKYLILFTKIIWEVYYVGKSENMMAYTQLKSFTSQEIFLAYQLLKYNQWECSLSLEKIGDVGIEGEVNHIIELKNADSKGNNPLSNSSTDLWKSIYNWSIYFYEHSDIDFSKFLLFLFVFSQNKCPTDIVEQIIKCNNDEKFKQLENDIIIKILKKDSYRKKRLSAIEKEYNGKNKSSKFFIECLLSKELYDYFKKVVYNFQCYKSEKKYYESLINAIKHNYGCEDMVECREIAKELLGWLHNEIAIFLDNNEPIIISTSKFANFTKQYIAPRLIQDKYKTHYQLDPSEIDINQQLKECPNYIKQLKIIQLNKEVQEVTAFNYLKLLLERKNWIDSGYISHITDGKYLSFQKNIQRNWITYKNVVQENDAVEKGKTIYNHMLTVKHGTFDGIELDQELVKGFVHELANMKVTDKLSIGWHPMYKELLSEIKDKRDGNENE